MSHTCWNGRNPVTLGLVEIENAKQIIYNKIYIFQKGKSQNFSNHDGGLDAFLGISEG